MEKNNLYFGQLLFVTKLPYGLCTSACGVCFEQVLHALPVFCRWRHLHKKTGNFRGNFKISIMVMKRNLKLGSELKTLALWLLEKVKKEKRSDKNAICKRRGVDNTFAYF